MGNNPRVAVCGATGAVGREMLNILEQRDFPASEVVPFASARSKGTKLPFKGSEIVVQELTHDCFKGFDLALFSAGGGTSKEFAPSAAKHGCVVVDNSS
ncbi:MAG: aspartate-semialdehyde dehydrogenase, partial [Proteobacteria bacterium]|nr:aspartate-semialdehyde dehydrogenase [Pseudomonadota bacterium]